MKNIKYFRRLLSLSLLILAACTTPAHKNTWYTDYDAESILIRVYSPDTFEIDGFMVDGKGLTQLIKATAKGRSLNRLIMEPMANASLFDQALVINIGEMNGLKTYRIGLFGASEISSKELLESRDAQEQ